MFSLSTKISTKLNKTIKFRSLLVCQCVCEWVCLFCFNGLSARVSIAGSVTPKLVAFPLKIVFLSVKLETKQPSNQPTHPLTQSLKFLFRLLSGWPPSEATPQNSSPRILCALISRTSHGLLRLCSGAYGGLIWPPPCRPNHGFSRCYFCASASLLHVAVSSPPATSVGGGAKRRVSVLPWLSRAPRVLPCRRRCCCC